jgi:hypothetical protein
MKRILLFILLIGYIGFGCNKPPKIKRKRYIVNSERFDFGVIKGLLDYPDIDEASGLVASRVNPGMYWTHNDSGDHPRIFLIDSLGQYMATLWLKDIENRDWEDIAIGPGPDSKTNYIYIGDIGDNFNRYSEKHIYRFVEPKINGKDTTISGIEKIAFSLPDGPRDTEALMVDPSTGDLYLITKRGSIDVYRLSFQQSLMQEQIAEKLISGLPFYGIVAADWSADGEEIVIKSSGNIFYWYMKENKVLTETLRSEPEILKYDPEPQGESIAFDIFGKGFYTVSEKKDNQPEFLFYNRKIPENN